MTVMRAKMRVTENQREKDSETLKMTAVSKSDGYDKSGDDENNTFAKWTPSADLSMYINNPALFGKFEVGQEFYVDFTKA